MKNYVVLVGLGVLGAAVAWSEGPDRTAAEPLDKSDEIRRPQEHEEIVTYRSTLMQGLSKHMRRVNDRAWAGSRASEGDAGARARSA